MSFFARFKSILIPTISLFLVVCFTVPLDSIISNQKYLVITPETIWFVLLASACILSLIFSLVFSLTRGKFFRVIKGIVCGALLAVFIQLLFLNSSLGTLNGSEPDWSSMTSQIVISGVVWIVSIIASIIFSVFAEYRYKTFSVALCVAVLAAQVSSMISGFLTNTDEKKYSEEYVLNGINQFTVSKKGNVLLFSLDYFSKDLFDIMIDIYPEIRQEFKDFTYYDNTCGSYDYTFPALCNLYTAKEYKGDVESLAYLEQAWNSDRANKYYKMLHDKGYQVNFYADINYMAGYGKNLVGKADNLKEAKIVMTPLAIMRIIKLSCYRIFPTGLKRFVVLSTDDLNEKVDYVCKDETNYESISLDYSFIEKIKNQSILFEESGFYYSCHHLLGAHVPYTTDENGERCDDSSDIQQCRGYLRAIYEFIKKMQENESYDNSIVIVTADHGNHPSYFIPLLVKEIGANNDSIQINSSPVAQADIMPIIADLLGEYIPEYGERALGFTELDARERTFRRFEILSGYGESKWTGSIGQHNMQKDWGSHHNVLLEYKFTGNQDTLKDMVDHGRHEILPLKDSFY